MSSPNNPNRTLHNLYLLLASIVALLAILGALSGAFSTTYQFITAHFSPGPSVVSTPTATPTTNPGATFVPGLGKYLGGVNLDGYCQSVGYERASLDGNTAYDWHCVTRSNNHVGINMRTVCQWQYPKEPKEKVIDHPDNINDPGSWHCYASG